MKSITFAFTILAACPPLLVTASSTGTGSASDGYITFNETQIDMATREGWCNAQVSQCPALCSDSGKGTRSNDCYPENLVYQCICDDGSRPNLTEYSEIIPYYLCTQKQGSCIAACNSNANCSENCKKTNICGATAPKNYNFTATSALPSATSTSSASPEQTSSSSESFTGKPNSATSVVLQIGSAYGLGLLATGFALGFCLIGGI